MKQKCRMMHYPFLIQMSFVSICKLGLQTQPLFTGCQWNFYRSYSRSPPTTDQTILVSSHLGQPPCQHILLARPYYSLEYAAIGEMLHIQRQRFGSASRSSFPGDLSSHSRRSFPLCSSFGSPALVICLFPFAWNTSSP
ncbi:hypothetical protein CY34DRAFT_627913 [Suillus luteus UH-Slu-Lm8-n1]|uniref:Uncharacterized protein n=1 Tax=Suillus luteus UH-Slu-Lm8-n1 TaxID=930992 RepID=A0A0D0B3C9_9AGAM|nr:hypothetical protein CY34DRAFT_627913 [Suillus luteus UH-Slu-Lm8-n1]